MFKSERKESGYIEKCPLSEFIGTCVGFDVLPRTGSFAKEGQKLVAWKFADIEVIESDEPYALKTAVIGINFSDSANSGYVVFEDSIAEAFEVDVSEAAIDLTKGARMRIVREDDYLFFKNKKGEKFTGTVWRVVEVMTAAKKARKAIDVALELLDGLDADTFLKAAVSNQVIKKDGKLCTAIISGDFLESKEVEAGFTLSDDGIYKKD